MKRSLFILAAVLALALWAAYGAPSFGQTVEVTPSTQPAQSVDGVLVQPPPTVKVHSVWTPEAVVWVVLTVISAIAVTLIPALIAMWRAVKSEAKSDANTERLDRQGAVQTEILKSMPPPSGGPGSTST